MAEGKELGSNLSAWPESRVPRRIRFLWKRGGRKPSRQPDDLRTPTPPSDREMALTPDSLPSPAASQPVAQRAHRERGTRAKPIPSPLIDRIREPCVRHRDHN